MNNISNQKNHVLLAGSFPPPEGGVASINEIIYHGFEDKPYAIVPLDAASLKRRKSIKSSTEILNLLFQCQQAIQFFYLVTRHHCRIVHISLSSGLGFYKSALLIIIATLLRKKRIIHLHGGHFHVFYRNQRPVIQRFIKMILHQGDTIIALSTYWKQILIHDFGILQKRVIVLNNCYDYQFNDNIFTKSIRSGTVKGHDLNLLFIGQLNEKKGIFDLLSICKELLRYGNHFILRIIGQEKTREMKRQIQNIIDSYNLSDYIQLVGEVRGEEKLRLFQQSDIFILPSYIENFPVTIVEAMRAGLPIVTTPVGSIPEIISDSINGYLIQPGDIHAFVDKILTLSKNTQLRQEMAQRNQEKAFNEYNPICYLKRLKEIYDFVLENRN